MSSRSNRLAEIVFKRREVTLWRGQQVVFSLAEMFGAVAFCFFFVVIVVAVLTRDYTLAAIAMASLVTSFALFFGQSVVEGRQSRALMKELGR